MTYHGENIFSGTAKFHAKYRPAYPAELFDDIIDFYELDGRGRLLDLGCGTGEMSIPLAKHFDKVLVIDPDPAMLAAGRAKAKAAGADNIEWKLGSSRELTGVGKGFKLITLGQSLHWMDEKRILSKLYRLLEPGGGLVVVGGGGVSLLGSKQSHLQPKDLAISRLVAKYLGPKRRAGDGIYKPSRLSWEQDLFPNSEFGEFEKRLYTKIEVRDVDQELGNLYSMSWARRDYFGPKIDRFEAEFKRDLMAINESGKFENKVVFEAFYLWK